jgi:hypothetical protein
MTGLQALFGGVAVCVAGLRSGPDRCRWAYRDLVSGSRLSLDPLRPEALEQNARMLEGVLEDFGVKGEIINVRPGPVVTLYELEPAPGIKSSRVIGLADDIARSMSAISPCVSPWCPAATPSASNCPTRSAKRSICAN